MDRALRDILQQVEYLNACIDAQDELLVKRCAAQLARNLAEEDHGLEPGADLDRIVIALCRIASTDKPLF